jgi:hypothetical protein
MKTWDKVTMVWDWHGFGIPTSVTMEGMLDLTIIDPKVISYTAKEKVHGLFQMTAHSFEDGGDRKGEMVLDIRRAHGPNTAPDSKALVHYLRERFKQLESGARPVCRNGVYIEPPKTKNWTDTKFILRFVLSDGEQFCDTVMQIGRAVFEGLGVKDENGYSLAGFTLKRESFVQLDNGWITFPRWLRIKHRLPIHGPEDM